MIDRDVKLSKICEGVRYALLIQLANEMNRRTNDPRGIGDLSPEMFRELETVVDGLMNGDAILSPPQPAGAGPKLSSRSPRAEFLNRLKIMRALDRDELSKAGVMPAFDEDAWYSFRRDPYSWMMRCSDEQCANLWDLIRERES